MFTTSQKHAAENRRLQDMAAIHHAAKHRAEQLRQEAIDSFFQKIASVVLAAVCRISVRRPTTSPSRALEN